MSTILSYGYYFPRYRVGDDILEGMTDTRGSVSKTFSQAFMDEDILTLSYEAAQNCIQNISVKIDAVFFATGTPVFQNRYHASFLANALNFGTHITALDFMSTPRAGTDALMLAHQLIDAGVHQNILIVAADLDYADIGAEVREATGHAACAFLLGKKNNTDEKSIGEIRYAGSFSASIAENFTYKGNDIALDPRFSREAGFKKNISNVLEMLSKNDIPKSSNPLYPYTAIPSFDAVILNSRFAKLAGGLFTKAGFNESQFAKDTISKSSGNTGAAHALLLLADVLDNGRKNILLFDYYNGTNVLSIEGSGTASGPAMHHIPDARKDIQTYRDYLKLRKAGNFSAPEFKAVDMFSSEMMNEREKDNVLYLNGFKCENCNTVYFIKSARCKHCKGTTFSSMTMQRTGTVYAITREHYFPLSFPPITMAVVDLDFGGRLTLQMTDDLYPEEKNKIEIGSRVQLVWRKMLENGLKPDYFWKIKLLNPLGISPLGETGMRQN
jgi:3-hydroxy-3-methylglutaryl CoA synthase